MGDGSGGWGGPAPQASEAGAAVAAHATMERVRCEGQDNSAPRGWGGRDVDVAAKQERSDADFRARQIDGGRYARRRVPRPRAWRATRRERLLLNLRRDVAALQREVMRGPIAGEGAERPADVPSDERDAAIDSRRGRYDVRGRPSSPLRGLTQQELLEASIKRDARERMAGEMKLKQKEAAENRKREEEQKKADAKAAAEVGAAGKART